MKRNWKSKRAATLQPGTPFAKNGCSVLRAGLLYLVAALSTLLVSCHAENAGQGSGHQHGITYTCPMHPQVVQEEPGDCPVCKMDLVPVNKGSDADTIALSDDLRYLLQPVNSTVVAAIRTVTPVQRQMPVAAEASGMITYDTRRSYTIPVRFGGRIEQLYVNYNLQPVSKGQKILEIYSPEIVTAQKELLYLLESDPANKRLIEASRQKLRLLGLTGAQISRLTETGTASYSLAVHSPFNGYIYESSAAAAMEQTPFRIREGMYLEKGQAAFKVINTERVWAEFTIYPQTAPQIKKGDPVTIIPDFNREAAVEAKVDFLLPFYGEGENFSKIRVHLDNPDGRFMPGQLVTARFQSQTDSTWWIPATAVLDLGTKRVVFKKEGPVFHPHAVKTGSASNGWTEVKEGLSAADTIAHDSHYMVDSEGFIKITNQE